MLEEMGLYYPIDQVSNILFEQRPSQSDFLCLDALIKEEFKDDSLFLCDCMKNLHL